MLKLIVFCCCRYFADIPAAEAAEDSPTMSLHPYFDFDVLRNVTARVGQTAFLHCRVEQLGDKSVSFVLIFQTDKNRKKKKNQNTNFINI